MNRLQRSMLNRYMWFAKYTDYLNRERLWAWLLLPLSVLYTIGKADGYDIWDTFSTVIVVGCLVWVRWAAKHLGMESITQWKFYSTFVEFYFWMLWVFVGMEFIAFIIGGINIGDVVVVSGKPDVVLEMLSTAFAATIHTYMLADIFAPPRPRKKVKVSIKVPSIRLALPEAA